MALCVRYHRSRDRGAFTLLEILLVLAILVVVGGVTMFSLRGPLDNQRLRRSADQVHAEWNRARVRAMKTGHAQVFRFQPGADTFEVQPWIGDEDQAVTADAHPDGAGGAAAAQQKNAGPKHLPVDVSFYSGDTATDARSAAAEQQIGAAGAWSRPIFFHPDGTSSTARVTLVNQRQRYVVLTLRGLTGMTHVSELLTASELPR